MEKKTTTQKDFLPVKPPVVVILGHIDHGKSSLLEAIRDFRITSREAGGITQHIGAYQIEEQGKKITFIDTPGHQAFSRMRARGAKIADLGVLVVDAVEGVKAQTKEAVSYLKDAGLPAIIAINKIDRPEADPEKAKRELSEAGLVVESLGGKIPCLNISAKNKQGIGDLLEIILLTAELEELKAETDKPAEGVILESHLDNLRGYTATLLVTNGCLQTGQTIVSANSAYAKARSMENFSGQIIKQALPSDPVIIFGFNQPPGVGDIFKSFTDFNRAEEYLKSILSPDKNKPLAYPSSEDEEVKILNLIIKTDVFGLIEVIEETLKSLPQEKVVVKILKAEAGHINESDIKLARSSRAAILGFRVKLDPIAKKIAEREKIRIFLFEVIYDLTEKVRQLMEQSLEPDEIRKEIGQLKVLAKFLAEKNRQIIGGRVIEGEVKKGTLIDILREDKKIGQGKIINLQRNKKDAQLINKGDECGLLFESQTAVEKGDILSFYVMTKVKGEL